MKTRIFSLFAAALGGVVIIAGANTFPGAGAGPIPDGPGPGCGVVGADLDITFTVAGESVAAPVDVGVELDLTHSWVGDVTVSLIAPGGATSSAIFGNTGSTTATGCGDSTDLGGAYGFFDDTVNPTNWWDEATAGGGADIMTVANYRATEFGGDGQVIPAPMVVIDDAFAGVADPNGTWTLRVTDSGGGDTGAVLAATLFLGQPVPVELMSFSIE